MKNNITFLGAAGTVTGSKTLVELEDSKVLIDCGLFQGLKELRNLNWVKPPIDIDQLDEVILTHAHLDHSGYLPVLIRNGFKGVIRCTPATKELTQIILMDSAKIQEEDAERANRYNYSKHDVAKPLYTVKDVHILMEYFRTHEYNEWVILNNDFKFKFVNSGHILGAAMVNAVINDKTYIFSGDIGRDKPLLLYPKKRMDRADVLILESTYGDRIHKNEDVLNELSKVIDENYERKGILMIPTFAVERTQELVYLLFQLREAGKLPNIPIYLDSPMGIDSTKVYDSYHELHNLPRYVIKNMYDHIKFIDDFEYSKEIVANHDPKIVLAGSGMLEGGRIIHYLNNHMQNKNNTLLFVGFQGEGTRGRAIMEGAREIKFYGEYHPVNCHIRSISALSGHADQTELLDWLSDFKEKPKTIYLNHGESHQRDALRVKINHLFPEIDVILPQPFIAYPMK